MAREDVERLLPTLSGKQFGLSPEDFNVNCLAYAMGDNSQWWEPPNGYGSYWPPGFPEDTSLLTVEAIIRKHGYTVETNPQDMPRTEAIAIFGESKDWTHFAKFSSGKWSSKLGEGHDVEDITLQDLEIPDYAKCVKVLSRPEKRRIW